MKRMLSLSNGRRHRFLPFNASVKSDIEFTACAQAIAVKLSGTFISNADRYVIISPTAHVHQIPVRNDRHDETNDAKKKTIKPE